MTKIELAKNTRLIICDLVDQMQEDKKPAEEIRAVLNALEKIQDYHVTAAIQGELD